MHGRHDQVVLDQADSLLEFLDRLARKDRHRLQGDYLSVAISRADPVNRHPSALDLAALESFIGMADSVRPGKGTRHSGMWLDDVARESLQETSTKLHRPSGDHNQVGTEGSNHFGEFDVESFSVTSIRDNLVQAEGLRFDSGVCRES